MGKPAKLNKPLTNRIIGHGEERVDDLLANPLNFRLHPDNQQQALAGGIDQIGFIRSLTVNQRTGRVVDGHLRVTLAARSNVDSLPVEYVDLTEEEEALALAMLDPIAAMAATDKQKLDELLRQVQSDDERVQAMLAEMAEREGLDYGKAEPAEDPGAQVDKAEELREKWGVEPGQLWGLGKGYYCPKCRKWHDL
jgi:ParB-like chromosome segregation protein Spo0J